MAQTKQQKRIGSLARLKAARANYAAKEDGLVGRAYCAKKIANLTKMIADTEAAIAKGGR